MVASLNHFVDWWRTYTTNGAPHKILRDEATGETSIYSVRSRQVVAKTICTRDELKAAGIPCPQ